MNLFSLKLSFQWIFNIIHTTMISSAEFRALLTGRGVLPTPVKTRAVGLVSLSVHRGQMTFCVIYSRLDRPKYLRIMDLNGNMLFERPIQKGVKGDRKVGD